MSRIPARPKNRALAALLPALLLLPAAAQESRPKAEKEAPKPTLHLLRLQGSYADLPETGFDLTALLGGSLEKPKGFYDLLALLDDLAGKDDPGHLLLDLSSDSIGLNLAQLSELEQAFAKIRAKGRKVTAWLTNAAPLHYQIACLCDQILMAEMGMLDLRAPAMEAMFYKDVLDLLGVRPTALRCGDFKGAVEPYVRSSMSRHLREHYREMLASCNDDLVRRISAGRRLPRVKVRQIQAQRLFQPAEAAAAGLVDGLTPWDDAVQAWRRHTGEEVVVKTLDLKGTKLDFSNPFALFSQLFSGPRKRGIRKDTVAVLHLSGTIVDGEKDEPGTIVSGPAARLIDGLAKEEKVRAVVVRINSPGGSATASERILLALRRLGRAKPVAVSMGNVAASGGYYIACLESPIYAEPCTLTGSIGVFALLLDVQTLVRRVGLNVETVGLDDSAGMGTMFEEPAEELQQWIQRYIDLTYDRFLSHVTLARRLPRQTLLTLAGGRVWSGAQALQHGLVDRLGGLKEALADVSSRAGLEPGKYEVAHLPEPRNPLALLMGDGGASLLAGLLPAPLRERLARSPFLVLLREAIRREGPARIWALPAVEIAVR